MKNKEYYLNRASMYDLLASYYKYSDPTKHIHYYQKHLKNIHKAIHTDRNQIISGPSYVRFLHAAPEVPSVDVYVNANLVLRNVSFKEVSDYLTLPPGKYHIDIYPAGNSVTTIISKKVSVEAGKIYTLATVGTGNKLQLLPYLDDPNVPSGETKARFIHLSPDAPAVDIAVKGGDVVFPKASYKQATEYLGLSPMTVNLEARVAGSKNVILSIPKVKLEADEAYTIVAIGFVEGNPELETIILKS
ncbi:DUF4397 domain-containing protein [Rossellomorea sp. BNER]|uniref:DUF4397 domain-containing protein n=1 Tax=Rossellomorea sp. BNER TaxID=2962031 RepID=UPI003AF314DB|nr:DUF4397 domain-containing protein [Rossellomorea sp. BNER]